MLKVLSDPPMTAQVKADMAGGLAGLLVSVPQTLAYGIIAVSVLGPEWTGLGVLAGLLGSVVAGVLAVVLGSNPVVVAGPRAVTVLVFAALLGQLLNLPGMTHGLALAYGCLAVVLAGVTQVLFGVLRMGRLADFIPAPVVGGFLNASALLILLSQIGPITGLGSGISVADAWAALPDMQPGPMALGLLTAASILMAPRFVRRVPAPLIGLPLGILVYHGAEALGFGGVLGGTIPPLPDAMSFSMADPRSLLAGLLAIDGAVLALLVPAALSMAALSALDAVLASVALDQMTLRRSNGDRELIAQGVGNAVSGMLGLLPSSGSMARSSMLVRAGGRSALAPLLTALMTAGVMLVLVPFVHVLPTAAVAGLLIVVGIDLFDKWTIGVLRRIPREGIRSQPITDLFAVAAVVGAALAFNLPVAVGVGVLVSLAFFVVSMARSPVRRCYPVGALAARLQGDRDRLAFLRRNANRIMIVELEGSLFFGSIAALQRQMDDLMEKGVVHVILDLKRVKDMDATAARTLERFDTLLNRKGGCLVLAYVEPERRTSGRETFSGVERRQAAPERRLWRVLDRTGSLRVIEPGRIQPDLDRAVEQCQRHITEADGVVGDMSQAKPAILRNLNGEQLRRLRPYIARGAARPGDVLFAQGDGPDSIYFLVSGRVEVSIGLPGTDRRMRIQTLADGAVFGEMAVIDPQPRSATICALVPSAYYRLPSENFARLKVEQPDLALSLLENLALIFAERLRASNVLVSQLEA